MTLRRIAIVLAAMTALVMPPDTARAQAPVRLRHSVAPAANLIPHAAPAPDTMPMRITVVLALRNSAALERLARDQQDPSSPLYHHWLTPAEFNRRFGPTQDDADAVARWLASAGFAQTTIDLERHLVSASANAAVVEHALATAIVSNGKLFANLDEPAIPAALAPLVADIQGLNNTFAVKSMIPDQGLRFGPPLPQTTPSPGAAALPDYNTAQLGFGFSPADLRTYYDENTLITAKITGTRTPDCIGLPETSNVHPGTFGRFTSRFGLPAVHFSRVLASGFNPGYNGAEIEADLDVEYAHAVAPMTPIRLYIGGGANDLLDAISAAVSENACGAISISFGYCGQPPSFFSGTLHPIFTQAALQGQTVFVSSGDDGAAGLNPACGPANSRNVSEMSADPNVVAVGGTQFNPLYDSRNKDTSTVLDGLESAWNEAGIGATGGGISTVFSRPGWQTGTGIGGTMRVVPDVAFGAAVNSPGFYVVVFLNGANRLAIVGGTSLSAPAWAGFSRLLGQYQGGTPPGRLGPMNPQLYVLGPLGAGTGLIDVTTGNNNFNGVTGYSAGPGYDLTTGWGSPDMTALMVSYLSAGNATVTPAALAVAPKTVVADAGVLTLSNTSSGPVSVASVTVNLSRPATFRTLTMTAGSQVAKPPKSRKMVFKFNPPISIGSGSMADFTLNAVMPPLAQSGTPSSTQTLGPLAISAKAAGEGVTFAGLPASLGTVTLIH